MNEEQKVRYKLITMALEKERSPELALQYAERMMRFVMGDTVKAVIEEKPSNTDVKVVADEKPKPKKKAQNSYSGYDKKNCAGKLLPAMIGLKESGQKVTIGKAGQVAFGELNALKNTAASLYLQENGYISRKGSGSATRWTILKSWDGQSYAPKTVKYPAAQAQGYGLTAKLGEIARVK